MRCLGLVGLCSRLVGMSFVGCCVFGGLLFVGYLSCEWVCGFAWVWFGSCWFGICWD